MRQAILRSNRFILLTTLFLFLFKLPAFSADLLPSIGLSSAPSDADPISTIPIYPDPIYGGSGPAIFDVNGPAVGDTIPDFTFYSVTDVPVNANALLASGKSLLIVSGSYTCPVFRNKVAEMEFIASTYSADLNVLVVYTVEAHPTNISPYYGFVNVGSANTAAGIFYTQPTTYGERRNIAQDMLASYPISVPMVLDGPGNEWWSAFGPAPNNAYLIDPDGLVFSKHGWFDKYPNDIISDIDSLLTGIGSGPSDYGGDFDVNFLADAVIFGDPGTTLTIPATFENNSTLPVLIEIERVTNVLPGAWQTSLCVDVCLLPTINSTTLELAAGQSQTFTLYFYTDPIRSSGQVMMRFTNAHDVSEVETINLAAATWDVGPDGKAEKGQTTTVAINRMLDVNSTYDEPTLLTLYNLAGQIFLSEKIEFGHSQFSTAGCPRGIYVVKIQDERTEARLSSEKVFIR